MVTPDLDSIHSLALNINELFVLADAAAAAPAVASSTANTQVDAINAAGSSAADLAAVRFEGWYAVVADAFERTLVRISTQLANVGIPYSYGWAIVALTFGVKTLTLPLTKQQVESAMNQQALQPKVKAIRARFEGDEERINKEVNRLYQENDVNPAAGCLPSLATIPVFISLYRALSNSAIDGYLNEGFYWIPTLSGPTDMAAQRAGLGTAWIWPLVPGVTTSSVDSLAASASSSGAENLLGAFYANYLSPEGLTTLFGGEPKIGWTDAELYLVLPILVTVAQFVSAKVLKSFTPQDPEKPPPWILDYLPLMIGYFSLNVPAGLQIYYLSNSVFTTAQQIYLRKLGGAVVTVERQEYQQDLGTCRRKMGEPLELAPVLALAAEGGDGDVAAAAVAEEGGDVAAAAAPSNGEEANGSADAPPVAREMPLAAALAASGAGDDETVPRELRRSRRRRRDLVEAETKEKESAFIAPSF